MIKVLIPYSLYLPSILLPISVGAFGYRRLKTDMKLILSLFVITLIVESISLVVAYEGHNNNWIHYIYLPIEYSLIAVVFCMWQSGAVLKKIIIYSVPIFILANIGSIIFLKGISQMNNLANSLSCILYVCIASYTLFNLQVDDSGLMSGNYRFWVCSALLLYAAGSLSVYAFTEIIVSYMVYYVHLAVNIIANYLYMVGFLCHIRRRI